jgi:hypothetical protein
VLEPWCVTGATGAVRVLDAPGGTVYLTEGRISYAECPLACGINRLLTGSGRLSSQSWRAVLATGRSGARVGAELSRLGLMPPAEVEIAVLAAIYAAAHFLFNARSRIRFEIGVTHPIGAVTDVDLQTACSEVDRRHQVLSEAWSDSGIDTTVIVPARQIDGHYVSLTALQWEIIVAAGRRRTPIEMARAMGRDTFATLLAVDQSEPPVGGDAASFATTCGGSVGNAGCPGGPRRRRPRRRRQARTWRISCHTSCGSAPAPTLGRSFLPYKPSR